MARRPVLWVLLLVGMFGFGVRAQELRRWGGVYYAGASDNNEIQALAPLATGGVYFAGWAGPSGTEDFWLGELSPGGDRSWAYPYGGTGEDVAYDMVPTADGGWIMVGYTRGFGVGGKDALVVKVKADRTVDWARYFGGTDTDVASAVRQTADGGYVVVGYTWSFSAGYGDGWLLKLGSTGTLLWYRSYGGSNHEERFNDVAIAADGNFVVAGFACSDPGPGQEQFWVMKVSSASGTEGDVLWSRRFSGNSAARAIQATAGGGFIVAGEMWATRGEDFFLVRLAEDGTVTWQRLFGGSQDDLAYGVVQTSDSGFVAVGLTASFGAQGLDGWAIKTDSTGVLQWQRYTRRAGDDVLYDVIALPDGYLGMGGETNQDGASVQEAWASRTTSEGVVFQCPSEGATAGVQEADATASYGWTPAINFGAVQSGEVTVTRGTSYFNGGPICEIDGPHLARESFWIDDDNNHDGVLDPGETITLGLTARNTGISGVTGVACSLYSSNIWVSVTQPDSGFPDMAVGAVGANSTDFQFFLGPGVSCGDSVPVTFTFTGNGGSIIPSSCNLVFTVGTLPAPSAVLDEDFSGGIPATWTVVDGGAGGGSASTWTTANPGGRGAATPITTPFAIVDSDYAGSSATQDEQLITPLLDLSGASAVTLEFDHYFYVYGGEIADVDVRSSRTSGVWTTVASWSGASSINPSHESLDITGQAAGASDVQVRWRYYNGSYAWYWEVDNATVTAQEGAVCNPKPQLPLEVSRPGQAPLQWGLFDGRLQMFWESKGTCGADSFNVYRATRANLDAGNYGTCRQSGLASHPFDETQTPGATVCWYYTVSGENGVGEGPLGYASGASSPTPPLSFCP